MSNCQVISNGISRTGYAGNNMKKILIVTSVSYICGLLAIFVLVNEEVPQPYMDEIFHVQQARSYCVGNFSQWNPKITTPPGLYLTTLGFLKPFSELYAFGEEDADRVCPTTMLRFVNLIFAAGNVYLIFMIHLQFHQTQSRGDHVRILLSSVSLSLFPLVFFFNFIFYTDPGSLFFVLLMYLYHLNSQTWLASFFGLVSLLYRQTNIVWLFFLAADHSLRIIQRNLDKLKKKTTRNRTISYVAIQIFTSCGGYAIAGTLFTIFVIVNKGIVVGDRSAHEASFNLPQLFYFFGFCAAFGSPWILRFENFRSFVQFAIKYRFQTFFTTMAVTLVIHSLATAHPYLLADNRHYTFYIWRRILNVDNPLKHSFFPIVYVFCSWCFLQCLQKKDWLWKCLFLLSTALSLVPQRLLEFRYFVIPYIIWRLNVTPPTSKQIVCELFLNIVINVMTLYIFLFRPFRWAHDASHVQRFMW